MVVAAADPVAGVPATCPSRDGLTPDCSEEFDPMRARFIAVVAAAVAAVATLAPPAQAAPLGDGIYRFPALKDGKCLIWYKPVTSPGAVSLGACAETASTSPDWQVRRRPNGTMDISKAGSDPRRCMKVNDDHKLMVNDNCEADRYADWTVSYGTDKP